MADTDQKLTTPKLTTVEGELPTPDVSAKVARLREVVANSPRHDTDPEVWDEITRDMEAFGELRRRATTAILD